MPLLTPEKLKQLFEERKAINAKKKEQQKRKEEKAKLSVKKALMRKYKAQQKKTPQKPIPERLNRTSVPVYHSNQFVREPNKDDLYQTWEEIREVETNPDESGRLNWDKLQELITRTKLKINEKKTGKNR